MKKYAALLAGLVLAACHAMTVPADAQVVHYLDNQGVNPQNVTPSQGLPVNCVTGCSGSGGGGDASAANQTAVQATAGSDASKAVAVQGITGGKAVKVDGSAVTQPVSASALPLPSGAATSANQTTGNTSLGTIATNTTGIATAANQTTANASLATIATAAQAGTTTTGSAVPASAVYMGANSGGNLTGVIQASASVPINISTATTTQLVALSGTTKIYVTGWDVIAAGTGNITLEYGTGSTCGTGTTVLTGAYNLTAQAGIARGNGLGPVLVVPAGNALCALTSAAVQMSGSLAYTQF